MATQGTAVMANERRVRRVGSGALSLVLGLAVLALAPTRAEAGQYPLMTTQITPITWLDGTGRQYTVLKVGSGGFFIGRDLPTGQPDLSWGSEQLAGGVTTPGVKLVQVPEPPNGVRLEPDVSVTDDGVVGLVAPLSSCDLDAVCDRWFLRFDGATGAEVAEPVLVEDAQPILRALDDGSYLTGWRDAPLGWVGPDGTDRGAPDLEAIGVAGADVDTAGRLLTISIDGAIDRRAPSSAPDLTMGSACTSHVAGIGASPTAGEGFGVACNQGNAFVVHRFTEAGALSWTTTAHDPDLPLARATEATVDDAGQVWVAGGTGIVGAPSPAGAWTVAAYGPQGATGVGSTRPNQTGNPAARDFGGGVTDLRTVGDGSLVAFADLKVCCFYGNNTSQNVQVFSNVLPFRPSPPTCPYPGAAILHADEQAIALEFRECDGPPHAMPTHYRVEVRESDVLIDQAVVDHDGSELHEVTFEGLGAGTVQSVTVIPVNDLGDGVGARRTNHVLLPFKGVESFIIRQADDLRGSPAQPAGIASTAANLKAGSATPADFMEAMLLASTRMPGIEATARLYRAAFLRDPDSAGLRYWSDRNRAGLRISQMAEQFTRSSEFVRRYGSLTDRQFVQLVYQNVLDRPADASGLASWTRKLANGAVTRGALLAQFSQSSEFRTKTDGFVKPMAITYAMLGRRTTSAERAAWLDEPNPYATIPTQILVTAEYAKAIQGR